MEANLRRHRLNGVLHLTRSQELLVICHGYRDSHENPAIVEIARGLARRGWGVFRFSFSDGGEASLEMQVRDLERIAERFSQKEIILVGCSMGAIPAAIAATRAQVRGLIAINGVFDIRSLGRRYWGYRLLSLFRPQYRKNLRYYRERLDAAEIMVPMLAVHAQKDRVAPLRQAAEFSERVPLGTLRMVTGADHHLTRREHRAAAVRLIDDWLRETVEKRVSL